MSEPNQQSSSATKQNSPLAPFRARSFTVLWSAALISNIGTWMYSAAAGWLMTDLSPDPFVVSLVQVASTLSTFLIALPAGALTDIVDRRHFLIAAQIATTLLCTLFAGIVALGLVTPIRLLLFTFLIGAAGASTMPAWQAIVPQLVEKAYLARAIALNSISVNISRAIGPAIGGLITGALGIAAPFWINAASNLGVIGALFWWRSQPRSRSQLPAERFVSSIRSGVRHARNNQPLRATLVRAIGFFLFASAYWALMPLLIRVQIGGGPELYGILLATIGIGAVSGAILLPVLEKKLGADRLVAAGSAATAIVLVLFGLARDAAMVLVAGLIAGFAWIAVLASLNIAVQFALPDWVRARGLSVYVTVFFGALTAGSAAWGKIAGFFGLPIAHFLAAAGLMATIPLTQRWKLQAASDIDLSPSMHWPAPIVGRDVPADQGPVLVTVEYHVDPAQREAFLAALEELSQERRRDGAYAWGIFEDTATAGRFVETFYVESWLGHLRQHERVTEADRLLQARIDGLTVDGKPKTTHLVAAKAGSSDGHIPAHGG